MSIQSHHAGDSYVNRSVPASCRGGGGHAERVIDLKATPEYAAVLRPLLPQEAFAPNTRHLTRITCHLAIAFAGYLLLRVSDAGWVRLLTPILIGHSMACLLFLAHDLSHGSVVRNRPARRALELLLWGLNLIPPTLWRCVHNQTHHPETNTLHDSDRVYRASEKTFAVLTYLRLFFPNRQTPFRHPLMLFNFIVYIARHLVTALLPGNVKPSIITCKPHYKTRHRLAILGELAFIGAAQVGLWLLLGSDWPRYLLAVPIPLLIASSVSMAYIWTNHLLNPLCEQTDALMGSTSVIVPRWADWLHDNFSYHTEHHVFPAMNPRFYPEVSRLLQAHFPERYNRLPFREAWRRIWQQDEFIRERTNEN